MKTLVIAIIAFLSAIVVIYVSILVIGIIQQYRYTIMALQKYIQDNDLILPSKDKLIELKAWAQQKYISDKRK